MRQCKLLFAEDDNFSLIFIGIIVCYQRRQLFDEQKKAVFAANSALSQAFQDISNQESLFDLL
jgi:hypothetical protein